MTGRQIVVVDVETTGLDPAVHSVIEVAWWNLNTGERAEFIPQHDTGKVLAKASVEALRVNRYIDRIAGAQQATDQIVAGLAVALKGNTLAGSNPAFDAAFLPQVSHFLRRPTWHHRLLDLSAYAAGRLGLDVHELPGLAKVCEHLGIDPPDHTAAGDVRATGECFLELMGR